jgi:Tol biopolymer transport system component
MITTHRARRVATVLGLAAGLAAGAAAPGAWAQYFGGNKVRYEDPDFHVLSTEHFDVYSYAEEDAGAADAAVLMERWHSRLDRLFDHSLSGRQPLILYAGHPQFRQTNATPGEIGEGTGGFTEMFKRRIVLPLAGAGRESNHVLGHELVHAYQFDIAKKIQQGPDRPRGRSRARLPLWFIEGMAEYLSLGSVDPNTAMWMRDAVLHDDLPTVERLDRSRYFPYRYGHAFWAYVGGRFGDAAVGRLLRSAETLGDLQKAIKKELGIDHKQLSKDWQDALKQQFGPAVAAAHPPADYGRALVAAKKGKGSINLSPSLSPDGRRLLFFSERDLFSIELYLLDVDSGKVLRRLTRSATDPHLDSLQFLYSAGSWSPDGTRIAIGSVERGRPALTILDAETGDTVAEHRFPELVEVMHPAWSPDGKRIAFAANQGGLLQLQVFELDTATRRPLTQGPYAAMQPAWSPDGKRLAFVTDRFTSDAERLSYGEYRLARLDLASGAVTPLPGLAGGKNINPQWSPDGRRLYFLSDARGGANLFRLDPASGAIEQLSDLKTGISGLTPLSPALSVAAQAPGRIAASVYDEGMYHLYLLDNLQGRKVSDAPAAAAQNQLPPRERVEPKVDALLADLTPAPRTVAVAGPQDYHPRLGVDYVSQINATVGTNNAGSFAGGGIALYWSDMLGDHNLLTLLQLEGDADTIDRNLAAVASYENREHRWGWGGAAGQTSSQAVAYETAFGTYNGEPALRERLIRQWQINREIAARTAYPFTRADRVEASVGYRHIGYITDAVEQIVSTNTGQLLASGIVDLPSPPSIELYPVGTAFVHDTSVFGGTAPAAGQRYRVELGGVLGGLSYYTPLADFRQYYLPFQYLTLAGRVMHYGRYGADAEDPRLGQVYVGSWTLVRGYDSGSFRLEECDPAAAPACPVFDQLFGSRIALASAEARVPVFGGRGLVYTPQVPPIDIAAFYDAGVAWTEAEPASFLGGPRHPVRSYGASVRVNFFGVLVLQWNYVDPLDRPEQDWYWEFLFAPGF